MIVPTLKAGQLDKKTTLTVSQPIVVGDTVLPVHQDLSVARVSGSRSSHSAFACQPTSGVFQMIADDRR
jgi:hypothetical protein